MWNWIKCVIFWWLSNYRASAILQIQFPCNMNKSNVSYLWFDSNVAWCSDRTVIYFEFESFIIHLNDLCFIVFISIHAPKIRIVSRRSPHITKNNVHSSGRTARTTSRIILKAALVDVVVVVVITLIKRKCFCLGIQYTFLDRVTIAELGDH